MNALLVGAGEDVCFLEDLSETEVIAVDGGYQVCRERGISPRLFFGDRDSYDGSVECPKRIYDSHKDATDMELAIKESLHKYDKLFLTGVLGGRLSHTVGNLNLLADSKRLYPKIVILGMKVKVFALQNQTICLDLTGYKYISLIPLDNYVDHVFLKGFQYPLIDATIERNTTLGISNEAKTAHQSIAVGDHPVLIFLENE